MRRHRTGAVPAARTPGGAPVEKEASVKKTTEARALARLEMRDHVREIIRLLGEDPSREGLKKTPERVEKSLEFLTRGYSLTPGEVIGEALFESDHDEMIIVKDIDFFSLCEHHLLPFFGRCHIAYLPSKKIIGLSKIPHLQPRRWRRKRR